MYGNSKRCTYYIDSLLDEEINDFQKKYYNYQSPSNRNTSSSDLKYTYNRTEFHSELPLRSSNNDKKLRYTYSIQKSTTKIPKILYEFSNISPIELHKKTMELLKLENAINNYRINDTEAKSKPKKKFKRSHTKSSINKNTFNNITKSHKISFSKSKSLKNNNTLKRRSSLNLGQLNLVNIKKEKYTKVKNGLSNSKKQLNYLNKKNQINKKIKNKGKFEKNLNNKNNINQIIKDKNKNLKLLLQNSNSIIKKQKDLIKKLKMKVNELEGKRK